MLFTFPPQQGIDSQYIKYCEEESGYVLDPRLRLGLKQREMVTEMLEMGWLFTSVVRYNQTIDGEETLQLYIPRLRYFRKFSAHFSFFLTVVATA